MAKNDLSKIEASKAAIVEAMSAMETGDAEGAVTAAQRARDDVAGSDEPQARLTAAFAAATLSQALGILDRLPEAAEALDLGLSELEGLLALPDVAPSARSLFGDALFQRAQLFAVFGDVPSGLGLLTRGVEQLQAAAGEATDEGLLPFARVCLLRAEFLADQGESLDLSQAEGLVRKAIELAADDPEARAEALDLLADVFDAQGDPRQGAETREEGLDALLIDQLDPHGIALAANEVADTWIEMGEVDRATAVVERASAALSSSEILEAEERDELLEELRLVLEPRSAGVWADPDVLPLLHRHAAGSFEKQLRLSDVVGEREWKLDLAGDCLLRFGDDLAFSIQVLGSESESAGTWLWAWANEAAGFKPESLEAANALKALGERDGLELLTTPEIALDQVDGHTLGMLAVGLLGGDAYYRGPYEGGAGFFMIQDPAYPAGETELTRLMTAFSQLISAFELNHRQAWAGYMEHHGFTTREEDGASIATTPQGELHAAFDELDRLVKLSANVT